MRKTILYSSLLFIFALLSFYSSINPGQAVRVSYGEIPVAGQFFNTPSFDTHRPADKIRRIENGLLPLVLLKGQPVSRMRLADRMRHYKIPGVGIAVINNYSVEWARGYGLAEKGTGRAVTAATLFNAGSISKPITAMTALRMVQEGKLGLDEDVNLKLASWKIPASEFTKDQKVTLRRLLSHSAGTTNPGVGEYTAGEKVPTLLEALDGKAPSKNPPTRVDFVPGSRWRYSGGGYAVVQQLLMDIKGKSFPFLVREIVFQKLGMRHSTFEQPPLPEELRALAATGHQPDGERYKTPFVYPEMAAAGLWTTPSDLARFVIELQKSKAGKSNRVLSREMTARMLTAQIENDGLGFFIAGEGKSLRFSHGGGNQGFFSYMVGYTETGQGAVVMTNGGDYWDLVHEIIRGIALEYEWPGYIQERVPLKVDARVYERLVGQYEIEPGFVLTIASEQGRLLLKDSETELFPESEIRYFTMDGRQIVFNVDEKDKIAGMTVQQNDFILRAKKIK